MKVSDLCLSISVLSRVQSILHLYDNCLEGWYHLFVVVLALPIVLLRVDDISVFQWSMYFSLSC